MKKIENLLVTMVVLRLYSCHIVTVKMVQYDDWIKGKKKKKGLTCCRREQVVVYKWGRVVVNKSWTSQTSRQQVVNKSRQWVRQVFCQQVLSMGQTSLVTRQWVGWVFNKSDFWGYDLFLNGIWMTYAKFINRPFTITCRVFKRYLVFKNRYISLHNSTTSHSLNLIFGRSTEIV